MATSVPEAPTVAPGAVSSPSHGDRRCRQPQETEGSALAGGPGRPRPDVPPPSRSRTTGRHYDRRLPLSRRVEPDAHHPRKTRGQGHLLLSRRPHDPLPPPRPPDRARRTPPRRPRLGSQHAVRAAAGRDLEPTTAHPANG